MDAAASSAGAPKPGARPIAVRGVVQGVGFRPFVYRLARARALTGWVLNDGEGVHIHIEGDGDVVDGFVRDLRALTPPASQIADIVVRSADVSASTTFEIRGSESDRRPVTRIPADIAVCGRCL